MVFGLAVFSDDLAPPPDRLKECHHDLDRRS